MEINSGISQKWAGHDIIRRYYHASISVLPTIEAVPRRPVWSEGFLSWLRDSNATGNSTQEGKSESSYGK